MKLSISDLVGAMGCSQANAEKYLDPINATLAKYAIDNPARVAAFIAQTGHECGELTISRENMNYSAERLLEIFPKYFKAEPGPGFVGDYAHQREKIASRAYGLRMGNGDESTEDGWKYRGGGLLQMTGKDDYRDFGLHVKEDLLGHPEFIEKPMFAALSAGWEWSRGGLNVHADLGNFERITKIINGGLNGYKDRCARWEKAKEFLCV